MRSQNDEEESGHKPPQVFAFNGKLKRDEPNLPAKLRSKGLKPSKLSRLTNDWTAQDKLQHYDQVAQMSSSDEFLGSEYNSNSERA